MRLFLTLIVVILLAGQGAGGTQLPPTEAWAAADRATRRLSPSAFATLPESIRADLDRRGCTIPQPWAARSPVNVVRGAFRAAESVDWTVLCSRQRVSTILVYWDGDPGTVTSFAERTDSDYLQVVNPGQIGFSRAISVATPAFIQEHYERHGGQTPPPLTHDGIDDAFVEKASIVWYWHEGRWIKLQGAD